MNELEDKVLDEKLARADEIRTLQSRGTVLTSLLAKNEELAASWPRLFLTTTKKVFIVAVLAWLTIGIGVHFIVFGLLTYSPAGYVACPMECASCAGPGRVFVWSTQKGSWRQGKGRNGYALVCHNAIVDTDTLTTADVHGVFNGALQPAIVNGFLAFAVEGILLGGLATLFFGATRTRKRKRALLEERTALEREQATHRERLEALGVSAE